MCCSIIKVVYDLIEVVKLFDAPGLFKLLTDYFLETYCVL